MGPVKMEAQIGAIREHESGRTQAEVGHDLNLTAQTFYCWKKQLGVMTSPDARRLRELEKENQALKQMLADGLQQALTRAISECGAPGSTSAPTTAPS